MGRKDRPLIVIPSVNASPARTQGCRGGIFRQRKGMPRLALGMSAAGIEVGLRQGTSPSTAIFQPMGPGFFGAMHAAIDLPGSFDAVTDDLAITMRTGRGQHMNCTLEAVKGSSLSRGSDLK
jgi:hypothetical protein